MPLRVALLLTVVACRGTLELTPTPGGSGNTLDTDATSDSDPTDSDASDTDASDTDEVRDCRFARVFGVASTSPTTWSGRLERVAGRDCPDAQLRCHVEWSGIEVGIVEPTDLCPGCDYGIRVRWGGRQDVLNFEEGVASRCGPIFDAYGGTEETMEITYLVDEETPRLWLHTPTGPMFYTDAVEYDENGTLSYRVDVR